MIRSSCSFLLLTLATEMNGPILNLSERKYVGRKIFAPVDLDGYLGPGGRRGDDSHSRLESDAGLLDLRARDRRIPREGLVGLNPLRRRGVRHPVPRAVAR